MDDQRFDLVVVGGGPGGYVCALKAAQLGLRVACVDRREGLGGTCLHVGCIPSKALLHASHLYEQARQDLGAFGVRVEGVGLDLAATMAYKRKVVEELTRGIAFLFRKNGVEHVRGHGRLLAPDRVEVTAPDGSVRELAARHVVLATGSVPATLPGIAVDEERIVTSTGALAFEQVPPRLLVIGGGYIGLELGTVWRRFGSRVTVVEYLDRLLPGLDGEVAATMQRLLARQGLEFLLGHRVLAVEEKEGALEAVVAPREGEGERRIACDAVLVAVGRRPHTEGLGLERVGLAPDERGFLPVDEKLQTPVAGISAIGDVVGGAMLAHKAEEEGVAVAERLAGRVAHVDYDIIPAVVFTRPEVASVGRTEEELKQAGIPYRVGKFPFSANSRARTTREGEGFVKILAEEGSDRVLGCHIVGPEAGVLIQEVANAMAFGAASEDIARICHPHPTLEEAVKEAALAAFEQPLHA